MRPLTLHVSALTDSEYDLYTASLDDLATTAVQATSYDRDDAHYEQTSVGVREARAWLRGRYSDLPASDIEAILKLFCPNMLSSDTLTGGQFFAALRLVLHALEGKGVDRTLAFVQASPKQTKLQDTPQPLSPSKWSVQAPPPHPDRHQKLPPCPASSPDTNPFMRRSMEHTTSPAVSSPADPDPVPALPPKRLASKLSQNPFLARDNADRSAPPQNISSPHHGKLPPLPPRKPALPAASSHRPSEPTLNHAFLPAIPLKPTHVMSPLMRQSFEASKHAQSIKRAEEQLEQERVLQVLKASSVSSSSSSSVHTTPGTRPRSLSPAKQVHKLPNGPDPGSDDATPTPFVPPLPRRRRRKPSLPSSASSSVLSFEQVANATLHSSTTAPPPPLLISKPPLPSRDAHGHHGSSSLVVSSLADSSTVPGPVPPPTHPYRRPSSSTDPTVNDASAPSTSSPPRLARSNSVTFSSNSTTTVVPPPPPPQRRRRPESVQLVPTSSDDLSIPSLPPAYAPQVRVPGPGHGRATSYSYQGQPSRGLSRHLSLTRDNKDKASLDPSSTRIAHLQQTLNHLSLRAQPKLEAVRYKAEAGLSRRGYVHHGHLGALGWQEEEGEEGLMRDVRRWRSGTDVDEPTTLALDDGDDSEDEDRGGDEHLHHAGRRSRAVDRDLLTESDHLKWPMGEGWKPL